MFNRILAISLLLLAVNAFAEQQTLSDPTRPAAYTGPVVKSVKSTKSESKKKQNQLMGIFVSQSGNSAIIDSTLVTRGKSINGYIVHRIDREKVILRRGDIYKTLTMTPKVKVLNIKG